MPHCSEQYGQCVLVSIAGKARLTTFHRCCLRTSPAIPRQGRRPSIVAPLYHLPITLWVIDFERHDRKTRRHEYREAANPVSARGVWPTVVAEAMDETL